jgi:hypothetical protein
VVRAHPTVPPRQPGQIIPIAAHLCCGVLSTPACQSRTVHPQFAQIICFGGIYDQQFSCWLDAGDRALGFDLVQLRPSLHPRTGAGLHRRRLPSLQLRNPQCRARHRLHGRQEIPALAAMPGAVQRPRAQPGHIGAGRQANGDQASGPAQVCYQGQGAQIQEIGKALQDLSAPRHFKPPSRDRLTPCGAIARQHLSGTRRG